jgi:hypothetical protein
MESPEMTYSSHRLSPSYCCGHDLPQELPPSEGWAQAVSAVVALSLPRGWRRVQPGSPPPRRMVVHITGLPGLKTQKK